MILWLALLAILTNIATIIWFYGWYRSVERRLSRLEAYKREKEQLL